MNIGSANRECIKRIQESTATLVDIRLAREVIPGMGERTVLHAGPPVTWDRMCGPMRGAIIGSCIFEGWAKTPEEAVALAASGELTFDPCHNHRAVGPMSGIITPSMEVHVVRNEIYGIETYATLFMGMGKVLRHGAYDEEVLAKLAWMNHELAPLLRKAIRRAGGIDLKNLIAQALQMGDEMHNRHKGANSLLLIALFPHLAHVGKPDEVEKAVRFIENAGLFTINSIMASCKAMLEAGCDIPGSTVVTVIARNGTETGIRVSGTGSQWFTAPAPMVEGVYFPGFGPEDANPDLGDSAITETMGLGSFAMAGAPAVVKFIGGSPQLAMQITRKMYEITLAEHDTFKIPLLDFQGTPLGIDIRKVVEPGITPVINTGIACKRPGVGQIGAGLTAAPLECFTKALETFAAARRESSPER